MVFGAKGESKMKVTIHPVSLGFDTCYILRGNGTIMIDAGMPGQAKRFVAAIRRLPMKPEEIKLIAITHGHFDHVGSARDIKNMTGAKTALHRRDKDWLEKSLQPPITGVTRWGKLLATMLTRLPSSFDIPATNVDIVLTDDGLSLADYGIPGNVIYTPGHTLGSVSVLLETGEVFVGDLAMNGFPLRIGPGFPIFAESLQKVMESWKSLLAAGAKMVYPAHGRPFSADIIRMALEPSLTR